MRTKGSNEDFFIETAQIINKLAKGSQFIVQLNNVQIPFSFYQLSSTSNLNVLPIYIKNPLDTNGRTTTITIPEGNYTPYTLIDALNKTLLAKCTQTGISGFTPFTPVFNSTYNPTNGYITFVLTSPTGCEIRLLFSTSQVTGLLGNFFGVGQHDVIMTTSTTPSSTQPCVLNPVNYLCIRSSLKQLRNREFIFIKDDVSDILSKVPILTQQSTYIQYIEPSEPLYIINDNISEIEFYLTNNLTYDPINLQNLPWSFTFTLIEVGRPDYSSISTTQAINILARPVPADNDIEALKKQRDEILSKLEVYKKKLEPKIEEKKKEKEVTKEDTKNAFDYGSSSHLTEYKTIQYKNMFEPSSVEPPIEEEKKAEK